MSDQNGMGLDEIPGLGRVRREALAEVGVVDLPGLLAMKVNELAAVRGIGIWQARKIREFLRQRGLLVEDGSAETAEAIVIHAPETVEEAAAVAEVVAALEAQAEAEARVQAEVDLISEALDKTPEIDSMEVSTSPGAQRIPVTIERSEPTAPEPEPEPEPEVAAAAESLEEEEAPAPEPEEDAGAVAELEARGEEPLAEEAPETSVLEDLRARRERLPEVALTLIEAIRQAAVSKQLTRQVTRLLITSGEFASGLPKSGEKLQEAVEALTQAEELLQRAVEKEAFSSKAQKELAERIRKRRKSLDRLLEEPEVEDR